MNSKLYFFLFYLITLVGCGVKAKPLTPPEHVINSYIESYTGTTQNQTLAPPIPTEKKKR